MRKRYFYLACIPSAVAFFALISDKRAFALIFGLCLGLLFGTCEYLYWYKRKPHLSKGFIVAAIILACLVCYDGAVGFYQTWLLSVDSLGTVITKVFSDYLLGLRVLSLVLGLAALPFTFFLIVIILTAVTRSLQAVDYKTVWTELMRKKPVRIRLKRVVTVAIQIVVAAFCGTMLLALAYSLPVGRIDDNVRSSAYTIQREGTYPELSAWFTSQLDNYTDSIMLLESAAKTDASPFLDAMIVPSGGIENCNAAETLTAHYIEGAQYDTTDQYPRYWHGYLVLLKPLLAFVDYNAIRSINGILQAVLILLSCLLLINKVGKAAAVPYVLSYMMLMPLALARSLQFSSCFYLFTLADITLLLMRENQRKTKAYLVFLYCGILTAFFDFLTYPIATFGVPMLFYLLLSGPDTAESKICSIVRNGFYWCIGLAGMWASKWILASIITGNNVVADGMNAATNRISSISIDGSTKYGKISCILKNYTAFFKSPVTVCVALLLICLFYRCRKRTDITYEKTVRVLLPFVLTGFAPVAWYLFATNHSMIHCFFTNKACIVSMLGLIFGMVCLLQTPHTVLLEAD